MKKFDEQFKMMVIRRIKESGKLPGKSANKKILPIPIWKKKFLWVLCHMFRLCCWRGICVVTWKIIRHFSGNEVLAMMVLITYDVSVTTDSGKKRLRKVAKQCVNYGQRVQNSVFECLLDPAQFAELKHRLESIINHETDSLRYYFLGTNWKNRVEHVGAKSGYDPEGILMI